MMTSTVKETPWVDAWVRWERNSKVYDANDGEHDDVAEDGDNNKLPPPTESYKFTYPNPALDRDNGECSIKLELKGYHDIALFVPTPRF